MPPISDDTPTAALGKPARAAQDAPRRYFYYDKVTINLIQRRGFDLCELLDTWDDRSDLTAEAFDQFVRTRIIQPALTSISYLQSARIITEATDRTHPEGHISVTKEAAGALLRTRRDYQNLDQAYRGMHCASDRVMLRNVLHDEVTRLLSSIIGLIGSCSSPHLFHVAGLMGLSKR